MDSALKDITTEYVNKANDTFALILELLGVSDRREVTILVRERNDTNFVINGQEYIIMPHGRGCFFSDGVNEIDWEFGDDCVCGIDPWMLGKFIKRYHPELFDKLSDYETKNEIKLAFDAACADGEATKKYDLYYLV